MSGVANRLAQISSEKIKIKRKSNLIKDTHEILIKKHLANKTFLKHEVDSQKKQFDPKFSNIKKNVDQSRVQAVMKRHLIRQKVLINHDKKNNQTNSPLYEKALAKVKSNNLKNKKLETVNVNGQENKESKTGMAKIASALYTKENGTTHIRLQNNQTKKIEKKQKECKTFVQKLESTIKTAREKTIIMQKKNESKFIKQKSSDSVNESKSVKTLLYSSLSVPFELISSFLTAEPNETNRTTDNAANVMVNKNIGNEEQKQNISTELTTWNLTFDTNRDMYLFLAALIVLFLIYFGI